jgi:hypothetical protein
VTLVDAAGAHELPMGDKHLVAHQILDHALRLLAPGQARSSRKPAPQGLPRRSRRS